MEQLDVRFTIHPSRFTSNTIVFAPYTFYPTPYTRAGGSIPYTFFYQVNPARPVKPLFQLFNRGKSCLKKYTDNNLACIKVVFREAIYKMSAFVCG